MLTKTRSNRKQIIFGALEELITKGPEKHSVVDR